MGFFYSFTETALHSLWQSAVIVAIYVCVTGVIKQMHPLQKRNFLYYMLAAQLLVSAGTFIIYFTGTGIVGILNVTGHLYNNSALFTWLNKYADIIFYAYAAGVLFKSGAVLTQWSGFKNDVAKGLIKPCAELKVFTALKALHLGIKRKVTLGYSSHIHSPLTFGFWKPFILLPCSLVNDITTEEAEAIILHELAHIKSRDYLLNWLMIIADILYFFNPFIKIITGKIKTEREKNCDVQVIQFNYSHLLYAEVLLKIARRSNAIKTFQLGAVTKRTALFQRIQFFSAGSNLIFREGNSGAVIGLCTALFITIASLLLPNNKTKQHPVSRSDFSALNNIIPEKYQSGNEDLKIVTAFSGKAKMRNAKKSSRPRRINEIASLENLQQELNTMPVLQAAFNEIPDSTKEFIYNVETQQGKMIQSFKLTLINGQWIMQPQWMIIETKPDSIRALINNVPATPPLQ